MINSQPSQWRQSARALGLDPQELKSVSSRYDLYKDYTDAQEGAETLDLPRWYKWYRVEKLSEGHAMTTPPAEGCSIGPDSSPQGPVISEAEFLQLLQQYRAKT